MDGTIQFRAPVPEAIRSAGLQPVDMHFHTNHSDSPTKVKDALKLAKRRGVGLAITDHNQISGVLEAHRVASGVMLIPGIEISANDGPHILLYFSVLAELRDFYRRHVVTNKRNAPFVAVRLNTREILQASEEYCCVVSEAHPFGYFFLSRGMAWCPDREGSGRSPRSRLDALEVICGGMARSHNLKAGTIARSLGLGCTGGTDGHLLHELGGVVTCARADSVEEFLDAIVHRRTVVIGREKSLPQKALMGAAVLPHHLPYAVPILQVRWEQNLPRIRRFVRGTRKDLS
ncbi:MAG: PHP domain-containing protein [Methanomicrobiales archaeon]|nr:PHP domain-containing protein [Methanomicrobiales archaeon]